MNSTAKLLGVLVEESQKLQTTYLMVRHIRPDIAELVKQAGVLIADAIGRIATEKTVVEMERVS